MSILKVGIIGSGNIGSDLMIKLLRSKKLKVTAMIGIDKESRGMKLAAEQGLEIFDGGIDSWADEPDSVDLLFDATSANAHLHNNDIAQKHRKIMIDLTPAAIGPFVVPSVNGQQRLTERNINMVTCGGQATTPIIAAVSQVQRLSYSEIVATISSKSAGPGTRANIDEFTETTAKAIEVIGGAEKGRAIIILNPAEPPIMMRDTVYMIVKDGTVKEKEVIASIHQMVEKVQQYVPGYRLRMEPIIEGQKITVFIEVTGQGDFLPAYAGNLDIMTSAAVQVAESIAEKQSEANTK
ncbi:MAG: acetaldehyde dehydrogenase (acetylating) [Kurthia sp.]|nr:acetaldehyde dehydrogenase (acetylating) [Candidatus Kurthia equi]